jgi:hypothetical protein
MSAETLARFLSENASLVAQKSMIGYCNVRTSLPLHELMRDKPFADAFERGRWQAFVAVLEDMFTIAEGRLRAADRLGEDPGLVRALVERFDSALGDAGEAIDREERQAATERLRARLQTAQAAPPQSIGEIARVSAERVYDAMPLHDRFTRPDREPIVAGVRFLMVGLAEEFDRRLDAAAIVADLRRTAATPATPPA